MRCDEARTLFSSYLDGRLSGSKMQLLAGHMQQCARCGSHYESLNRVQAMVSGLGPKAAPPELALRLRLAISREQSMSLRRRFQGLAQRLENQLNSLMLPATGGLITAVIIFGLLIGLFGVPSNLGSVNQVPTLLYVPPRLTAAPFVNGFSNVENSGAVLIEAYVDTKGRIADYRILSGRDSDEIRRELERRLIFTVFEPAMSFGKPAPAKVVLSFDSVNVSG